MANRVQEFRESRAWTKAELGRRSGVDVRTITKMENGEYTRKDRRNAVVNAFELPFRTVFPND